MGHRKRVQISLNFCNVFADNVVKLMNQNHILAFLKSVALVVCALAAKGRRSRILIDCVAGIADAPENQVRGNHLRIG